MTCAESSVCNRRVHGATAASHRSAPDGHGREAAPHRCRPFAGSRTRSGWRSSRPSASRSPASSTAAPAPATHRWARSLTSSSPRRCLIAARTTRCTPITRSPACGRPPNAPRARRRLLSRRPPAASDDCPLTLRDEDPRPRREAALGRRTSRMLWVTEQTLKFTCPTRTESSEWPTAPRPATTRSSTTSSRGLGRCRLSESPEQARGTWAQTRPSPIPGK